MKSTLILLKYFLVAIFYFTSAEVFANEPIKIGMTTALSGPAEALGEKMRLGVQIYFDKVNAHGGIDGRKLELIVYDDGYEPLRAAPNMRRLIEDDNVLAILGNVGTPTATLTVPIANESKVLLFGAYTGAGILRKTPPDRYIINFRSSYEEETTAIIEGLLSSGFKPEEIAFFTQNDAYGNLEYKGVMKALQQAGLSDPTSLPHGRYNRNTTNVEEGLSKLLLSDNDIKAIVILGAYEPVAKFIQLAGEEFPDALFINVSFVGGIPLAKELKTDTENVIVTQVVPLFSSSLPAVEEYRRDLLKYGRGAPPSFVSLEGYLVAKLFVLALRKASKEGRLDREGIIDTLESMKDVDIGIGLNVGFDENEHQALHKVWPTIINRGEFEPLDWKDLNSN